MVKFEYEDLYQIGVLGLMKAADEHDSAKGEIVGYMMLMSKWQILRAIKDYPLIKYRGWQKRKREGFTDSGYLSLNKPNDEGDEFINIQKSKEIPQDRKIMAKLELEHARKFAKNWIGYKNSSDYKRFFELAAEGKTGLEIAKALKCTPSNVAVMRRTFRKKFKDFMAGKEKTKWGRQAQGG